MSISSSVIRNPKIFENQGKLDALHINKALESIEEKQEGNSLTSLFKFIDTFIGTIGMNFSGQFLDRLHSVAPEEVLEKASKKLENSICTESDESNTAHRLGQSILMTLGYAKGIASRKFELTQNYLNGFFEGLKDKYKPMLKLRIDSFIDSFFEQKSKPGTTSQSAAAS